MNSNGTTAKWVGLIAGVILVLGFGSIGMIQAATSGKVQRNQDDIRVIQINQAVILEGFKHINEINKKLDRLLEED